MEADYVVVGGGPAGCLLATRLAAPGRTVILVEEGSAAQAETLAAPAAALAAAPRAGLRHIESEPDPTVGGRRHVWSTPRGFGVEHGLDTLRFTPASVAEHARWPASGTPGWSAAAIAAAYDSIAATAANAGETRLALEPAPSAHPLTAAFAAACRTLGLEVSLPALTLRGGRRDTAYGRWLRPHRRDRELVVLDEARVLSLQLDGKRCIGLFARRRGRDLQIRARAEVILAAGVFGSPKLLLVSGIGPPGLLEGAGLKVRHALNGVGAQLADHAAVSLSVAARLGGLARRDRTLPWSLIRRLDWQVTGRGPFALPSLLAAATAAVAGGEVELLLTPAMLAGGPAPPLELGATPGLTLTLYVRRPRSRGRLRLSGAGVDDRLRIEHLLLSNADEVAALVAGSRLAARVLASEPLAGLVSGATDRELGETVTAERWVRDHAVPLGHAVGTCRMGSAEDADAVVDAGLRVHGLAGLRVADASVMPDVPAAGPRAAALMVAARAAALLGGGV